MMYPKLGDVYLVPGKKVVVGIDEYRGKINQDEEGGDPIAWSIVNCSDIVMKDCSLYYEGGLIFSIFDIDVAIEKNILVFNQDY